MLFAQKSQRALSHTNIWGKQLQKEKEFYQNANER